MTTVTPNYQLTLFDAESDPATQSFIAYRLAQSGPANSNMTKIDTALAEQQAEILALQSSKGAIAVAAQIAAPNYYVASVPAITAYQQDMIILLRLDMTCTSTVTLNINELGTKTLMKINNIGELVNLDAGDMVQNRESYFRYNGTCWIWLAGTSGEQVSVPGTIGNILWNNQGVIGSSDIKMQDTANVIDYVKKGLHPCDGRLTLVSGNPTPTGESTAATNVYFTPYQGSSVALFDNTAGNVWKILQLPEKSFGVTKTLTCNITSGSTIVAVNNQILAQYPLPLDAGMQVTGTGIPDGTTISSITTLTLTGITTWQINISAAATASNTVAELTFKIPENTNADILMDHLGNLFPSLWATDTTRNGTGRSVSSSQDGVVYYTQTFSGTTPKIFMGRYLGTIRTTATAGQTEKSNTKKFVWNYYNQIFEEFTKTIAAGHAYPTATTRSWNNDDTARVEMVCGFDAEVELIGEFTQYGGGTNNSGGSTSIMVDATNAMSLMGSFVNDNAAYIRGSVLRKFRQALGYHYYQLVERGAASANFAVAAIHGGIYG
jgi:hypothetical protein